MPIVTDIQKIKLIYGLLDTTSLSLDKLGSDLNQIKTKLLYLPRTELDKLYAALKLSK